MVCGGVDVFVYMDMALVLTSYCLGQMGTQLVEVQLSGQQERFTYR